MIYVYLYHPSSQKSLCLPISPKGLCIAPLLSFLYVGFLHQIRMFMSTYITQGTLHCPLYKISTFKSFSPYDYLYHPSSLHVYLYHPRDPALPPLLISHTFVFYNKKIVLIVSMSTYITQGSFK